MDSSLRLLSIITVFQIFLFNQIKLNILKLVNKLFNSFKKLLICLLLFKMGACQNQFHNVPDLQVESSPSEHQRQRERQRFTSKSISLPHKSLRPNSKSVKIGMIESQYQGIHSRQTMPVSYKSQYLGSKQRNSTYDEGRLPQQSFDQGQLDRQELHQTKRPFEKQEYAYVPQQRGKIVRNQQKQYKQLTLDFFYSLGLPQYNYPPIPEQYKHQYQSDIQMREQEQRSGVKYIGQWKDSQIHGNGVLKSNTVKYIGQFRNGLRNFNGREIQREEVYQGGFWADRRKGTGIRYTPILTEQGEFNEHLIKGRIMYDNGDYYEGELLDKKYHGNGKLYDQENKILYQGEFKQGKLDGKGSILYSDGKKYQGQFEGGLKHGYGKFQWNDDNYYNGNYMKGKKHGKGCLTKNGVNHQGTFKNGAMNGKMVVYKTKDKGKHNQRYEQYQNGIQTSKQYQPSYIQQSQDLPDDWKKAIIINQKHK